MRALREWGAQLGIVLLDATTRTWGAFWGTCFVWGFYWTWNSDGPRGDRFDPYPFVFLTLLITMASYLQNIVLMTDQRKQAIELASLRVKQVAQDARMLHLMEAVNKACELLVEHAEQAASRDVRAEQRAVEIVGILRSAEFAGK